MKNADTVMGEVNCHQRPRLPVIRNRSAAIASRPPTILNTQLLLLVEF